MDKNLLCEAMYALQSGVVVRRKKSLLPSIAVLGAGIALIVLYFLMRANWSNNFASSMVLLAGMVALIGLLMVISRLTDSEGCPWFSTTNEPLRYMERYFPIERRGEIQRLVNEGAFKRLLAMDSNDVSGIAVAIYHSKDGSFATMQAYEYIDFEYRPITNIKIVE
ncbi:MAG: hypothetical protein IKZ12_03380 [Alistipes sp.]|nr:hypothetical protein [Alistipes sp.]